MRGTAHSTCQLPSSQPRLTQSQSASTSRLPAAAGGVELRQAALHTAGVPQLGSLAKIFLVLGCVTACKSHADGTPSGASVSSSSAGVGRAPPTSASASAGAVVAPPRLQEGDVKSFVARWEAAQNDHDFAAYSGLYAARFMGVKRVGTYSKRFDRAAWLQDRKPMFQGGAKVSIAELELVAASGSTRVIFTQEFSSTGFRDIGKKELFLVPSAAGIAISREEMLDSRVSSASSSAEGVLAYHRDGAVLERGFDKARLESQPRLLSSAPSTSLEITFKVAAEALSAGSRAWLGREVTAYTASGQSCTGHVARFEVRVQAVPHFGMRQTWNGELDAPKATAEQIAQSIESMARDEEHFVVGVLDRACAGTWASGAVHAFTPALPATGLLRETGISAFKALPGYAELQQKFVKEAGDPRRAWETVDGALTVVELRPPARAALLVVSARGGVGCSGFSGSLSAFWQIGGTASAPKLTPLSVPSSTEYLTVHGAIDEGSAAGLALLSGPDGFNDEVAVLRPSSLKDARRVLLDTSFWDCDC